MEYRNIVNNIIADAKLLTKMTARQVSIFRRKIYNRISEASDSEELHKEIPYPNKKRKIIDKDNNIGSLLIMYKGLIERYNSFTLNAKKIQKKNYELECALHISERCLYFKTLETIVYKVMLIGILMSFIWMDFQTFMSYKCIYKKYKKVINDTLVLCFTFFLENYLVPLFNVLIKFINTYIFPFLNVLFCRVY